MLYDIAIVGAGMAGASLAAELAPHARIVLLEAEEQPGYHATGRSAAFWNETYGGPLVQPLTSASGAFLAAPPAGFAEQSFLTPRGALHIARRDDAPILDALAGRFAGSVVLEPLDRTQIEDAIPGILPGWDSGLAEPSCADIDVAALHAAYLRAARRGGAVLRTSSRVLAARRQADGWHVETSDGVFGAATLVNAAGAWASRVAEIAGAAPVAIQPLRRTVVQLLVDPAAPAALPLVLDAAGRFYFKPEPGGRIWLSPHDETPAVPGDAAAEEIDVARAIDRLEQVVDWRIVKRERAWAGLRSFAPDRVPVYGFDARAPGFFWFAGQGGFGIQTAPAAAQLAAALLLGRTPPEMVRAIDAERYSPRRFEV